MISVIIPVYNTKKYLEKCVLSVLHQTYKELEVILVNDGSTDGSLEVCRSLEEKDKRVTVISQTNQGLSAARNAGLKVARGDIIAFVDSDDFLDENMYEKLLQILNEYDVDIAGCNYRKVNEEGEPLEKEALTVENDTVHIFTPKEAVMELCEGKYATRLTVAHCKIYRRELFATISYPVGKVHEDEYVTYKLFNMSKKVAYYEKMLYNYTQRSGSIMSDIANVKLSVFDKTDALLERVRYFEDDADSTFKELLVRRYFEEYLKVLRLYVRAKGATKEAKAQMADYKQNLKKYSIFIHSETMQTFGKQYRNICKDMYKVQIKKTIKKILRK